MDLKGAQKDVHEWILRYGVRYFDELTNMVQLTEEVGEVARIISRRYGEQSEKESDREKDLGEEYLSKPNKQRMLKNLAKKADELGMRLVPCEG